MEECPICIEKYDNNVFMCKAENDKKEKCNFHACIPCYKQYLLNSSNEPHCMQCRVMVSFEQQIDLFSQKWVLGPYKKYRENLLLAQERQRFGNDLIEIENTKEVEIMKKQKDLLNIQFEKEKKSFEDEINKLRIAHHAKIRILDDKIWKINGKSKERTKVESHYQCPDPNCLGILNKDFNCILCDQETCKACYVIKKEEHTCDPDQVETFREIKSNSRNCPTCGIFISKKSGCDQMFCIQCGTSFSWKTGKVELGIIHNPHAHAFFERNPEARERYLENRNGGNGGNEANPCRDFIPQYFQIRDLLPDSIKLKVNSIHRKVSEFRNYHRNNYIQIIENPMNENSNRDLRIAFLKKDINEKHFKSQLHMRSKKYNFRKNMYPHRISTFEIVEFFLWEMANNGVKVESSEKIKKIAQNKKVFDSIQELIRETNKSITNIKHKFGYYAQYEFSSELYIFSQ